MAKTYRGILIFVVILGIVMGLAGKKFDGYVYTNTEPRSNTECTLTQRVFDDADVLTDEEEAKLEKLIAEKEKLIGGDIVLMTTNDASLNTMEKLRDYAQNYYKENKIGWDKPIGSGAIYVDDWETKHTWLATRGTVKDKLSKDNTDYIVDETNDIVNKDPYKAYTRLINLLAVLSQRFNLRHRRTACRRLSLDESCPDLRPAERDVVHQRIQNDVSAFSKLIALLTDRGKRRF